MYSIILVDDEISLRQSIEKLVDWEKYNFQLIGTAENGLDALELMEEKGVPDVVITDIKMPIMNGIEFAKQLRENYPTIKIVFLSGYDEFDYAIEGIRLNVVSYLLKPISKDEIEQCLRTLSNQLDEEIFALNDMSRVSEEYHKNSQLMQLTFLNSLLTENQFKISNDDLEDMLLNHQLIHLKDNKRILVSRFSINNTDYRTPQTEFQRFSLYKLVQDVTEKYIKCTVFMFSSYVVSIITGTSEELNDLTNIITKDISDSVNKLLNRTVLIGISNTYDDIFHTKRSYLQAVSALDYAKNVEDENVIYISDLENTSSTPQFIDRLDESSLLIALKTNHIEYINYLFETFFKDVQRAGENRISLLRTFSSIIYVNCIRALRETIGFVNKEYNKSYYDIFELMQIGDLNNLHSELLQYCYKAMNAIHENRNNQKNSIVGESLQYLEENFTYSELSLKSVSEYLNVSSSYFSSIFKKETGKSFIDTLTEMKMTKARELVITTDKRMFEIAAECGYDDQHYFSYNFKKYYGVSPTQMRKQMLQANL